MTGDSSSRRRGSKRGIFPWDLVGLGRPQAWLPPRREQHCCVSPRCARTSPRRCGPSGGHSKEVARCWLPCPGEGSRRWWPPPQDFCCFGRGFQVSSHQPGGLLPPEVGERPWLGSRAQCPHTCPHPGARASLREAKAHPNLGGNPQFGFPPAGPAGSLAARLGAIYTLLHGAERPGGKAKEVKLLWGRNDTTRL